MRTSLFAAAVVAAVVCVPLGDAVACGDKFLVVGRGVRYQDQLFQLQANILVYSNPTLSNSAVSDLELEQTLARAGHTYRVVTDMDELREQIGSARYDIVLVDVRDAELIRETLLRGSVDAAILPVVYREDKQEVADAKEKYDTVLKAPARSRYLLAVIDDTLNRRAKSAEKGG